MREMKKGDVKKARESKIHVIERASLAGLLGALPGSVYSHSVRVGVLASILAGSAPELTEYYGFKDDRESKSAAFDGGLYHELGRVTGTENEEQCLQITEEFLREFGERRRMSEAGRGLIFDMVSNRLERADGSGPRGLTGDKIPLAAGLLAIADALDNALYEDGSEQNFRRIREYIAGQSDRKFLSRAVNCFDLSRKHIFALYRKNYHKRA